MEAGRYTTFVGLIALLAAGCESAAGPRESEEVTLEAVAVDTTQSLTREMHMDEHRLMAICDSLIGEGVERWMMDSSALTSQEEFRDPLLYFDRIGATAYFKRSGASILVFSDSGTAGDAFRAVVHELAADPTKKHIGQYDMSAKRLVTTVFSKSGSTHLLTGRVIVHLLGSCGESRAEFDRRLLFGRVLSDCGVLGGLMSMRCGWSDLKIEPAASPTTS